MSSVGPLRLTSSQLTVEEAGWWDGGQLGFEPGSAEPRPLPSHTTRSAQHSCPPLGQRRRARCAVRFWARKAVAGAGRCERGPGVRGWPRSSCTPAVPGCAQVCFLSARSAHRAPGLAELRGLAEGCPDSPGASACDRMLGLVSSPGGEGSRPRRFYFGGRCTLSRLSCWW